MSYFSTALTRITERNQLRQADVVRDAGLTRSHVSRLFSGEQRTIPLRAWICGVEATAS